MTDPAINEILTGAVRRARYMMKGAARCSKGAAPALAPCAGVRSGDNGGGQGGRVRPALAFPMTE